MMRRALGSNGGATSRAILLALFMAAGLVGVQLGCDDAGTDGDADVDADADSDADADGDAGMLCTDECMTSGDGECDDGGADSLYSICDFGTDCTDCGERDPADCVPDCGSGEYLVECGPDGCGGSCGECAGGAECLWGECCTPDCAGATCGSDGCGGSCGQCDDGQYCTDEGGCALCSCGTRVCGYDQCYNSCGECDDAQYCTAEGTCAACSCGTRVCGYDECGNSCGQCGVLEACTEGACTACTCTDGPECGQDAAGCLCGTCATGFCDDRTGTCDPAATAMCNNSCRYAADGDCDDGGRGCDYSLCEFGSDCADCGSRTEADRLPEGTGCSGGE